MNEQQSILASIGKAILSFFLAKKEEKKGKLPAVTVDVKIPIGTPEPPVENAPKKEDARVDLSYLPITAIDWTCPTSQVSDHFTVGEAITLHSWNRLATIEDGLTDEVKSNIVNICNKMEQIRKVLGCSINVHCIFRSVTYNEQVLKSIPHDVHSMGLAIDFDCNPKYTIQQIKDILEPLLGQYSIRMERGTTTWIHIDIHAVGVSGAYFTA